MVIKYAGFGVKYQNILVVRHLINYEEMFVSTPIYIMCVVVTILIFISMLAIEFFILHYFVPFLGVYLRTYLSLSLTGLWCILDKF